MNRIPSGSSHEDGSIILEVIINWTDRHVSSYHFYIGLMAKRHHLSMLSYPSDHLSMAKNPKNDGKVHIKSRFPKMEGVAPVIFPFNGIFFYKPIVFGVQYHHGHGKPQITIVIKKTSRNLLVPYASMLGFRTPAMLASSENDHGLQLLSCLKGQLIELIYRYRYRHRCRCREDVDEASFGWCIWRFFKLGIPPNHPNLAHFRSF